MNLLCPRYVGATIALIAAISIWGHNKFIVSPTLSNCPIINNFEVNGTSMTPLIPNGAKVVLYDLDCHGSLEQEDIIVFDSGASSNPIIKTIKAIPKDIFALVPVAGRPSLLHITVNDMVVTNSAGQPYTYSENRAKMLRLAEREYNGVAPSDLYLVLGDRPDGSLDSARYGFIHKKDIRGVAEVLTGEIME